MIKAVNIYYKKVVVNKKIKKIVAITISIISVLCQSEESEHITFYNQMD